MGKQVKKDEYLKPEDIVIKKSIRCKVCKRKLINLAILGDWDEGFECGNCNIAYDAWGKEI